MKRILALFLALVMIFAMVPALGTTAKADTNATSTEAVTTKPFYGLTWHDVDRSLFPNLAYAPAMTIKIEDGQLMFGHSGSFESYVKNIKTALDALPEGARQVRLFGTLKAYEVEAELVIYVDKGVEQLKNLVTRFIEEYYAIGGKLDGIILDTEYFEMGNWYLYSHNYGNHYSPTNPDFYKQMEEHPQFETEIRPLLEERGFVFHEPYTSSSVPARNSILYSMYPQQFLTDTEKEKYANCQAIWNRVMNNRMSEFMTEAVYEPLAALYPDAVVSDYQDTDSAAWENYMSTSGGVATASGSEVKTGNVSNWNMYNHIPNADFFVNDNGVYQYKNIWGYNGASYDDDSYASLMYNVNRFRSMYAATDTKMISVWIDEYDYSGRANATKNSPYYTEFMYHVGMMDPQNFLVWMARDMDKFKGEAGLVEYNKRMAVIDQIMAELTRVAGYSDRKYIETPQAWNDGFMVSGMYAGGRNIWRLTPDTTDGTSLLRFKVSGTTDPTFSINGCTITFPGGKIITDSTIGEVGSCGYWIETSKDVTPVITRDADFHASNPALLETFDGLAAGTMVNSPNTKPMQTWSLGVATGTTSSNSISMKGTSSYFSTKSLALPSSLYNATDTYSKQHQVWDVQLSLPSGLRAEAQIMLMMCGSDGGFKVENKKVYYDNNGTYVEMPDVTLALGSTYRFRREVDFSVSGAYTCDYSVYDYKGTLLGSVSNVPMMSVSLPVKKLNYDWKKVQNSSGTNLTATVKNGTAGIPLYVESYNGSNALALTGTATLDNLKLPKNVTAGDVYAMQQAWEISFTLAGALTTGSATLFNGMVKLQSGKLYYNSNGSYVALADVAAGTKYTININNDFTNSKATYTLSADGAVVATAENVTVPAVTTPVSSISFTSTGVTTKVYLDDYKLYATGREYSIKFFDAENGIAESATEKLTNDKVAFRIGWMNATNTDAKGQIRVARYDNSGKLVSDTILRTFDMKANFEGAETGVLENTTGSLTVYLHICDKANTTLVGYVEGSCTVTGYTGDLICNDCGGIYEQGTEDRASGHKKKTIAGKAATCTTDGLTRGEECTVCGEVIVAQQVIPAAHKETIIAGKEATCTTAGKTEGVRCSRCGLTLVAQTVIPAGHKEDILPGKEATCDADGLTEGKQCVTCGEVLVAQTVIPALEHTYGEPIKENVVGESCTEAGSYDLVSYCSICNMEASRETITVDALGHNEQILPGKGATCTEDGITEGKQCATCGEITLEQTVIPATGHKEGAAVKENYVAATETENGSYELVISCEHCGIELSREPIIVPATGAPTTPTAPSEPETTAPTTSVPGEALEATYTVKIDTVTYTISKYDAPVYSVNATKTGYYNTVSNSVVTDSKTAEYPGQNLGGDESNYNAKLVWHTGDEAPTLYLRNLIIDNYNEDLGKWRYSSATNKNYLANAAIFTGSTAPLKIVIEGGESYIRTYDGLHFRENLTIESVGDASLKLETNRTGIVPTTVASGYINKTSQYVTGKTLTLNANLNVTLRYWANEINGAYIIRNVGGDIIVNGGNIVTDYTGVAKNCYGVAIIDSGNLYVNGGHIYAQSYNTANLSSAAYMIAGNVYVTGGILEAYSKEQSGVRADNIYVTGGEVKLDVHYGGLVVDGNTGVISITGGTVEADPRATSGGNAFAYVYMGSNGKESQSLHKPVLGEDAIVTAGSTKDTATVKDAATYDFKGGYVKVEVPVTEPEQPEQPEQPEEPGCNHTEEIVPGKAATCTEVGYTEGKICTTCGERTVLRQEIAALGHTEKTTVETKAATCTESGYTKTTVTCEICGETTVEQEVIEAKGHTEVVIPGSDATCTSVGYTEGKGCSVCGELVVPQTVIPALGHTAGEAVKENETETSYDTVVYCSVCNAELSRKTTVVKPGECTEHVYTDDNDAVCNNCGYVRQMTDEYKFENYRVVFADSNTEHKNARVELYTLGEQTVADPTDEKALRAIDANYGSYWGASHINKILITAAGNYVALLKYNVGTTTVKVPLVFSVDADPKLIIDQNNKLTVLDTTETHGHLRIFVYYLGDQTVEDIYDEAALQAIDPDAAKNENIIYHKMFIDRTALTKGGNYVVHLCWNIGTGPKITKAQQFTVFAIPTLTLDVNNMLWMSDENAENNSHRLTIYKMADDLDLDNYDIYDESAVKKAAISTSKTYWGAAEINGLEIYERGNYIIHLNYSVGTSAKRTIAIASFLNDRPVAGVTDENKLSMTFTDPDITNARVYYYYFGENSTEGLDLYDKNALKNAAVSANTGGVWGTSAINKHTLKDLGKYVIHFEYNVKTYNEDGTAAGSAKKVVVVETTIYDPTKPTLTVGEDNKLVFASTNTDATNYRATVYNLGDQTVADPTNETALKAIDSAPVTKWGVSEINKVQLTEGNNYVVLVKYNLGTQTRTVAFQFAG